MLSYYCTLTYSSYTSLATFWLVQCVLCVGKKGTPLHTTLRAILTFAQQTSISHGSFCKGLWMEVTNCHPSTSFQCCDKEETHLHSTYMPLIRLKYSQKWVIFSRKFRAYHTQSSIAKRFRDTTVYDKVNRRVKHNEQIIQQEENVQDKRNMVPEKKYADCSIQI